MVEKIATITPIATRNTPFTISLMMPQRMPNTPKAVRIIKPHIANPMYCAICLKFAVAVISSLFLIFLFLMRIQELRELSFKLSYLPLVYSEEDIPGLIDRTVGRDEKTDFLYQGKHRQKHDKLYRKKK